MREVRRGLNNGRILICIAPIYYKVIHILFSEACWIVKDYCFAMLTLSKKELGSL